MLEQVGIIGLVIGLIFLFGLGFILVNSYRKVDQGKAIVRNGFGGAKVNFSGLVVIPVIHRAETMDISVKRIEIHRQGSEGLICRDNMRADIKVVFFVKVNKTIEDVLKVAQLIGCDRASNQTTLVELFDAKFSEALKTVGKKFDFVDLYNARREFKDEVQQIIGTDLNGYILEDTAIDYLEQTPMTELDPFNILDAEGIKKITDLTATQRVQANKIERERDKSLKRQDVEAKEQILELERQQAEAEERQRREIASTKARETAETMKVQQEERLKAEQARIATEEEVQIAEENKARQVLVAQMSKEKTGAVEKERVEKDRLLEVNERERVVELARIEKERALEEERKNIQEIIRERVTVERSVVEEQEKIKDTQATAEADRNKAVAITAASSQAEEEALRQVKAAEAGKRAAELKAEQNVVEAEADRKASDLKAEARKLMAEAKAAEEAAIGLAEAEVMTAKADASEKMGNVEASIHEKKALAEAKGLEAHAVAIEKQGEAEANVLQRKSHAEALGIEKKADAMKKLDGVGREHEEFKLRLNQAKEIELAKILAQKDIAASQAAIIQEALRTAKIDIVGGDGAFFDKITSTITQGKAVDRLVSNSEVLSDVKETFFNGDPEYFKSQLKKFVGQFGMTSEDVKNLTLSALVSRMISLSDNEETTGLLKHGMGILEKLGLGGQSASLLFK